MSCLEEDYSFKHGTASSEWGDDNYFLGEGVTMKRSSACLFLIFREELITKTGIKPSKFGAGKVEYINHCMHWTSTLRIIQPGSIVAVTCALFRVSCNINLLKYQLELDMMQHVLNNEQIIIQYCNYIQYLIFRSWSLLVPTLPRVLNASLKTVYSQRQRGI